MYIPMDLVRRDIRGKQCKQLPGVLMQRELTSRQQAKETYLGTKVTYYRGKRDL
jgi:hypothetical protein